MGKAKAARNHQPWAESKKRLRLSDAHVQMARELGLNPKKLGCLANHEQEPWKAPLPIFIEELYRKRFQRDRPQQVSPWQGPVPNDDTRAKPTTS